MNYHSITKCDVANGVGIRVVLWVSGCEHKCKDCHNPETWDINSGLPFTDGSMEKLLREIQKPYVDGLTLSGGDPLHTKNREKIAEIIKTVKTKCPNKSIWLYTGYRWEEIKTLSCISYVDYIVDGEYKCSERDVTLPFRGSRNQRIIDVQKSLGNDEVILYDKV